MTGIKVWTSATDHWEFPGATSWMEHEDGGLDVTQTEPIETGGEQTTIVATFAPRTWIMVQLIMDKPVKLIPADTPNADRIGHSAYEPCVVGAGGRCTRMGHDHSDEITDRDA